MANSFDPQVQKVDLTSKVVVGLERLSEVFRVLLWEKAKDTGLSPIQIQILLFLSTHDKMLANVSHLSKEFNLKKPTVSDAIKALHDKGLVLKEPGDDGRAYTIIPSDKGQHMIKQVEGFETPLIKAISTLSSDQKTSLHASLSQLIYQLNQAGIIETQRTCFGCSFYEKNTKGHYCQFIKKPLNGGDIRLDCDDFEIALN